MRVLRLPTASPTPTQVYQGIRPTGKPPDTYEFERPYVRGRSLVQRVGEIGWNIVARCVLQPYW